MILCDTNILIEAYRKNSAVISVLNTIIQNDTIAISDVVRAEILIGARNKNEMQVLSRELEQIQCLPIQSEISALSINLLKQYYLSHNLDFHDALIAATAIHHNIKLYTLNIKDFVFIDGINLLQK